MSKLKIDDKPTIINEMITKADVILDTVKARKKSKNKSKKTLSAPK